MPIISTILGVAALAAGAAGTAASFKEQGTQQNALKDQNQIAQQEMQDKQQVFNQDEAFYTPYTQNGSPYLQNIQSAAAGQNAQQTNNAAGLFRQTMGQSGMGYGPSGATAAGLAGLGANAATTGANNYLANLLNNEQVKFQAQSGLNAAGTMAGATQNQPSVSTQLPAANGFSSLGALGQAAGTLAQGTSSVPTSTTTVPTTSTNPQQGPPPTAGWTI